MRTPNFSDMPQEDQDRIDAYLDGTIGQADFDALQDRMAKNPALRAVMRRYLALDDSVRNVVASVGEKSSTAATAPWLAADGSGEANAANPAEKVIRIPMLMPLALAASVVFLLGLGILFLNFKPTPQSGAALVRADSLEPVARGFAVIGRLSDAKWPSAESGHREGDTLGAEIFRLAGGTAEIQFFSGAAMTVQGPAEISLKSAWEASCSEGAVHVRVPPAARGFKLHAPTTEIIDLGTEFGLAVRGGKGHVEVFEGEIALRPEGADRMVLKKGGALGLNPNTAPVPATAGQVAFPDLDRNGARAAQQRQTDFERWKTHRDGLAQDPRLLLYYTFDRENRASLIPSLTEPRNPELDGAVVLAEPVDGRWPGLKSALEFRRPGSRVRVNIPGEFPAFTFIGWVRIDSLDRWYNALFMADSYETGEPHWQIRNDGQMILSVMVDDARPDPKGPPGATMRFQHLYYSPPMWDPSMSGQWMHLASVFDPPNRQVSHFVNGKRISREEIEPKYLIKTLRIGNGEVGNWGQPFREDPTFAIRNLNGRMDELAIFKTALGEEEIARHFEESRADRR
ncbi:MAG: LamG-like jellyroll fold domain-containing protein [Chthoniobacteraceae bacterium]